MKKYFFLIVIAILFVLSGCKYSDELQAYKNFTKANYVQGNVTIKIETDEENNMVNYFKVLSFETGKSGTIISFKETKMSLIKDIYINAKDAENNKVNLHYDDFYITIDLNELKDDDLIYVDLEDIEISREKGDGYLDVTYDGYALLNVPSEDRRDEDFEVTLRYYSANKKVTRIELALKDVISKLDTGELEFDDEQIPNSYIIMYIDDYSKRGDVEQPLLTTNDAMVDETWLANMLAEDLAKALKYGFSDLFKPSYRLELDYHRYKIVQGTKDPLEIKGKIINEDTGSITYTNHFDIIGSYDSNTLGTYTLTVKTSEDGVVLTDEITVEVIPEDFSFALDKLDYYIRKDYFEIPKMTGKITSNNGDVYEISDEDLIYDRNLKISNECIYFLDVETVFKGKTYKAQATLRVQESDLIATTFTVTDEKVINYFVVDEYLLIATSTTLYKYDINTKTIIGSVNLNGEYINHYLKDDYLYVATRISSSPSTSAIAKIKLSDLELEKEIEINEYPYSIIVDNRDIAYFTVKEGQNDNIRKLDFESETCTITSLDSGLKEIILYDEENDIMAVLGIPSSNPPEKYIYSEEKQAFIMDVTSGRYDFFEMDINAIKGNYLFTRNYFESEKWMYRFENDQFSLIEYKISTRYNYVHLEEFYAIEGNYLYILYADEGIWDLYDPVYDSHIIRYNLETNEYDVYDLYDTYNGLKNRSFSEIYVLNDKAYLYNKELNIFEVYSFE